MDNRDSLNRLGPQWLIGRMKGLQSDLWRNRFEQPRFDAILLEMEECEDLLSEFLLRKK